MKKTLKKILCTALCAVMALSFAACNSDDSNNPGAEHTLKVSVYAAGYGTAGSRKPAASIRRVTRSRI